MKNQKIYCPNCNQLVTPEITEYEEGLEGFESGKLCPICEEYIERTRSKFYLVDSSSNIFTGFEVDENGNKYYCYENGSDSDFRNSAKHFPSIPAIETYFREHGMPLYPTQHKVLEYDEIKERLYTHSF